MSFIRFSGKLELSKQPSKATLARTDQLDANEDPGFPAGWCNWKIQGNELVAVGESCFGYWREWLEYIIEKILEPEGITVSGESVFDVGNPLKSGILTVSENEINVEYFGDILDDRRRMRSALACIHNVSLAMVDHLKPEESLPARKFLAILTIADNALGASSCAEIETWKEDD